MHIYVSVYVYGGIYMYRKIINILELNPNPKQTALI